MAGPGTSGGYVGGNKLFKICVGLGSSGLMMDEGRVALLRTTDVQGRDPNTPPIIPLVVLLVYVPQDEYKTFILESVVKLFANPDRETRMVPPDVLPFR
ncbi:hypothetical protein EDB92DRAFT_1471114 [Lactarius akahatsu]|uniref:Uncharacterized protein n=1 Tax=Lactarius akahatsu TaxID=416441 RepID=A0AAD4QAI0_9AGAM|nr:hypothetical protein EDB92DRAFT_1471114 [Lactarius akahatsu]